MTTSTIKEHFDLLFDILDTAFSRILVLLMGFQAVLPHTEMVEDILNFSRGFGFGIVIE